MIPSTPFSHVWINTDGITTGVISETTEKPISGRDNFRIPKEVVFSVVSGSC